MAELDILNVPQSEQESAVDDMKQSLVATLLVLIAFTLISTLLWEMEGVFPTRFLPVPIVLRRSPSTVPHTTLATTSAIIPTTENPQTTLEPIPDRKFGCDPIGNIIFIKTHKTGSTTMRSILNRYGVFNNLSFLQHRSKPGGHIVTDLSRVHLSAFLPPLGVHTGDTKRYRGYNISNTHIRMYVSKFKQLMNPNSSYITILRHPVQQWLSAFQYFHVGNSFKDYNASEKDRVKIFLSNPKQFARKSAYAWNSQIYDLGVSRSLFQKGKFLEKKIAYFSKLFDLVLITEYFDESLILLRDRMCWTFEDILYVKMRAQPKPLKATAEVQRQIWEWNKADAMLYTHFNDTLWQKIRDYGPNFERHLEHFRALLDEKYNECVGEKEVVKVSGNHKNVIYGIKNDTEFCKGLLGRGLLYVIHERQNSDPIVKAKNISSTNTPSASTKSTKSSSSAKAQNTPKAKTITKPKSANKEAAVVYKKVEGQCNTSQSNIVFVKTHKTGSTTLTSILNRYGYTRNLSFIEMSTSGGGHFNYHTPSLRRRQEFLPPIGVAKGDFQNYSGYNISAVHIRYSRGLMEVLMGDSVTYYISILREPVSQFVSAFQYFDVVRNLPANTTCATLEECILKFLELPKTVFERRPFAWNNQLLDLGMDKMRMYKTSSVARHLSLLEKEFDLLLIMEYFDESLILLKKLLCWEYRDILYIKKRVRPSHGYNLSLSTVDRIRKHNHADGLLYRYFNITLWRRIADYGPSFKDDLRTFRTLLNSTLDNCIEKTVVKSLNRGQENIEQVPLKNASVLCKDIVDMARINAEIRRRQGGV